MTHTKDTQAGYRAYARYQGYAEAALRIYGQPDRIADRQTIWSDICLACVRLSLSESR